MSTDQQLAVARATRGESTHLSKAAQKVVPPFLQKLYEIVNDPKNHELIRWSESGDSFYVLNHERFAREVLGRWFKHQKFTSFVRQLNMYGFHKIPHLQQGVLKSENDTEPWHFEHPNFHRGQPDLLCLIQRKKQSPHGVVDDMPMDLSDGATPTAPLANLTPGQVLDINSIMNGISAIKRHQQAISSDLNELKSSNQHLWQEALAARERHKKHQDTINRILKFLAGVFGNSEDVVKHDVSHNSPPVIPRKRQRLMIESGTVPEKRKAAAVEEVEDDNDDHVINMQRNQVDPTQLYASIETPEIVSSPRSPSVAPSDGLGPTITDISSTYRSPIPPALRPTDILTHTSSELPQSPNNPTSTLRPQYEERSESAPNMSLTTTTPQAPQSNSPEWSSLLQNILNSPSQMQRLMQALAAQQNQPAPAMPLPHPEPVATPSVDPRVVNQQVATYDPGFYDLSRFRTEPAPAAPNASLHPSMLGPLITKDEGPALEPLVESANRLQKTYHDAAEINADVDALQLSLNSLIHNLGLDPTAVQVPQGQEPVPMTTDIPQISTNGTLPDPSADFDFDAFFNEMSRNSGDPGFTDVTGRFDPATQINGTALGDASTDQLTAFLDDVSDTASLQEQHHEQPTKVPSKRKSDVADLPPPLLSTDVETQSPKMRRKR